MNSLGTSTLKNFQTYLKLKNYADRTIQTYSWALSVFLHNVGKSAIHLSSNDFNNFLSTYSFTSPQQQNQFISALKLFREKIQHKKFNRIDFDRPRREKILPKIVDSNLILDSIEKIKNIKHKAIISLAYSVGLRVSEVINLKISDIDSKRMIIHINQAKGKKDRIVPLSPNILEILRQYYKEFKPKTFLFNGQNSLQYSSGSCNAIVKKYLGKDFHFHLLRHSCFTHLIENGTDCRIIQKLAGHSSVKTTEIYMQVSTKTLKTIKLPI